VDGAIAGTFVMDDELAKVGAIKTKVADVLGQLPPHVGIKGEDGETILLDEDVILESFLADATGVVTLVPVFDPVVEDNKDFDDNASVSSSCSESSTSSSSSSSSSDSEGGDIPAPVEQALNKFQGVFPNKEVYMDFVAYMRPKKEFVEYLGYDNKTMKGRKNNLTKEQAIEWEAALVKSLSQMELVMSLRALGVRPKKLKKRKLKELFRQMKAVGMWRRRHGKHGRHKKHGKHGKFGPRGGRGGFGPGWRGGFGPGGPGPRGFGPPPHAPGGFGPFGPPPPFGHDEGDEAEGHGPPSHGPHHGGHHGPPHHGGHHHGPHHGGHHHGPHHGGPHHGPHHGGHHHGPHHGGHHHGSHHDWVFVNESGSDEKNYEGPFGRGMRGCRRGGRGGRFHPFMNREGGRKCRGKNKKLTGSKKMARLVRHVNVGDGTNMAPGEKFTKKWIVRNDAEEAWPKDSKLVHIGGDQLETADTEAIVVKDAVKPGESKEVSVGPLTAPQLPGLYKTYYRFQDPEGKRFGQRLWCEVMATSSTSSSS